jgi:hypothetical protein
MLPKAYGCSYRGIRATIIQYKVLHEIGWANRGHRNEHG